MPLEKYEMKNILNLNDELIWGDVWYMFMKTATKQHK